MPPTGSGEKKINLKIINHPIFREEALCLLTTLEKYEKMEVKKNRPKRW